MLDRKLKEAKSVNLELYRISYHSLFDNPPAHLDEDFQSIAEDISSWPNVSPISIRQYVGCRMADVDSYRTEKNILNVGSYQGIN